MSWSTITGAGTTTATKFFGDVMNKINNMLNGTDITDTVSIHSNVTWTFKGSALKVRDSDDSHSYTFVGDNLAANRTITLPLLGGNDVMVTADYVQTLTNKKLQDSTTTIIDEGDATKAGKFQVSGITTGNTRTLTWPDFDGTIATLAGTETFTNKTLTSPTLTTPKIANGGYIADANGNEQIVLNTTASAVPYITVTNAVTGNDPVLGAAGETNVNLKLSPNGTGAVYGAVETIEVPLSSDSATSAPSTGVVYTSLPMPADFNVIGCVLGVKTAGTGANLVRADVLVENSVNADAFTTIFSTKPTIDASEFTSTTAATPYVLTSNPTVIAKGKRVQYKIDQIDSNSLARGYKIGLIGYYTAKPSG